MEGEILHEQRTFLTTEDIKLLGRIPDPAKRAETERRLTTFRQQQELERRHPAELLIDTPGGSLPGAVEPPSSEPDPNAERYLTFIDGTHAAQSIPPELREKCREKIRRGCIANGTSGTAR